MNRDEKTSGEQDWAARVAGVVDLLIGDVRERVLHPVFVAVRALVLAAVVLTLVLVLVSVGAVGLIRLFDTSVFSGRAWATDLLLGGIFLAAGMLCWALSGRPSKRTAHG
ncbi:MAG TPA: hypothetical protein VED84_08105 [Acidimicrobiales bacterium]|nr:hypothetical protein [Acidimicrobiales bacterium]